MGAPAISIDRSQDGLARLAIGRPPVNVLGIAELGELASAITQARVARVILLTGLPRAFSAGVSVPEHVPEGAAIGRMLAAMRSVLTALVDSPAVTVAAIRGACLGGGAEIAAACDVVLAAEDARVGFPEIRLGCFPPGAIAMLPLRVGPARAGEWILSGQVLSGRESAAAGFASKAVPAASLESEADRCCADLLARGAAGLRAVTGLLREPRREALSGALVRAERAYRDLEGDPDLDRAVRDWTRG